MQKPTTQAQKILSRSPSSYFLVTKPGDHDIDHYSLIIQIPRTRESAFIRASLKKGFSAHEFGEVIYYTAGELTLAEAKTKTQSLTS